MKASNLSHISAKLARIAGHVHLAEHKIGRGPQFPTSAPREAVYAPSPAWLFVRTVQEMGLPRDSRFVDLGSGIGNICFTAAFCFEQVVGYELDISLLAEAEGIRRELGLNNVSFRREDFIFADLSGAQIVYFYKPFCRNFSFLMAALVNRLSPGTVVIANTADVERAGIFDRASFRPIFSLEGIEPVAAHVHKFSAYERI